jgi:hypothetical protein
MANTTVSVDISSNLPEDKVGSYKVSWWMRKHKQPYSVIDNFQLCAADTVLKTLVAIL